MRGPTLKHRGVGGRERFAEHDSERPHVDGGGVAFVAEEAVYRPVWPRANV
jgi:hypothetical protein